MAQMVPFILAASGFKQNYGESSEIILKALETLSPEERGKVYDPIRKVTPQGTVLREEMIDPDFVNKLIISGKLTPESIFPKTITSGTLEGLAIRAGRASATGTARV